MRLHALSVPLAIATIFLIGCNTGPSEAFLRAFRASEESKKTPALVVHLGKRVEISSFDTSANARFKAAIESLANRMGFRVEASEVKHGYFTRGTAYDLVAFQTPQLPGLTFLQESDHVTIQPDYHEELILEWAKPPKEGYETLLSDQRMGADKGSLEAGLMAMGVKDPKAMLEKLAKADEETRKAKAKGFAENIERTRKDNGYAKAWFLQFRKRETTAVPADSPWWALCEGLSGTSPALEFNTPYRATATFWTRKGQADTKATLRTHAVIAFEGASGVCAKIEPWSTFQPE
jgi:hypothetical protein